MRQQAIDRAPVQLLHRQRSGSFIEEFDFAIEPYRGCNFGCAYCFVPHKTAALTGMPVERWGRWRDQPSHPGRVRRVGVKVASPAARHGPA